ncbi:MAG: N-acetylneuraminate synthase family protein [Acidobacteriota bacterium]
MSLKPRRISVASSTLGEAEPAFILAEVASAHQGQREQALALARAAQEAGASGVKLQIFRAAELVAPDDPRFSTFQKIELSIADWEALLDEVRSLGLPVLADAFDRPSLALAERHGVAAYKIHSTDMENPDFLRAVAATGKPLLLSTGGIGLGAVEWAIEQVRAEGNDRLVLMHGVQNFPTRVEDSHLRFLSTLKAAFGFPVGFLDHVDGGSATAELLPALAVAFGADLVEKHITLDRRSKGFDYESALEPNRFRKMVELVRDAERASGSPAALRGESAEDYHGSMRRAVVSRESLRPGEPLRPGQVAFLRNERGLSPREVGRIMGRKPRQEIPAWQALTEELFE